MAGQKIVKSKFFLEDDFLESLAEVPAKEVGAWKPDKKLKVVGSPVSRVDGYDKVSGTAQYTFDVSLPHMAVAKTLRCRHPHARIKSIDTAKALKLPGVLAIITHKNTPAIPWYSDTSFLFDPHLRYLGDEVACAAAESEEIAAEALKLIKVEYEILPFVTDAKKAMEANAPKLYKEGNIRDGKPFTYKRGDAEKGFKEADAVVEDTFTTQVEVHNPTEVHCSVANWDGDRLTVWDSTQAVFNVRDALAQSLKIPANQVRVIKKYMGGGFGSKLTLGKYTVMAALLARKIGRPVKIDLDRKEMNLAVGNRPDSVQKLKAGAKKDGTLTALSHYAYGAVGSHPSSAGCSWPLRTVYQCDNVDVEEYSVYINAGPARPMRAPGHVQGTFAMDSLIDELAEKINMDPLEFRLKNYAEKDQVYNIPYTSKRLREAYKKGAEAIGWHRRSQPAGAGAGPVRHGIGMATQIWWGGGGPPAYATIRLYRDGSVHVMAGTQDIGTGTYTFITQVVAEVLEIPLEKITVTLGDTGRCPYCPLSGGSLTAPSVSPAVHDAAEQIKAKLLSGAAALLELPEDQLDYEKGVISNKKDPSKKITITDILSKTRERELIATGARNANPQGYMINTFGAQFAEVEVDTETGKIKVLKVVAAHDIGRVLNWKTAENQIHGGIIQGISFALMEQRIIDHPTGTVLTTNMHDYKMPTVMDMPEIEAYVVSDADNMISSVGAKGLGEPAHIPTAGAIANAVYNATGVRIKSLPMTPDKVLTALQQARRVS
ncbi:MAG: xanthine dehydrogenase family protein molybdopterin-binding subunit [Candidatus Aminicenantes bacterium]|jgi:xanthine dehydrogenase YagR molybdenum-binding subunit